MHLTVDNVAQHARSERVCRSTHTENLSLAHTRPAVHTNGILILFQKAQGNKEAQWFSIYFVNPAPPQICKVRCL